jgi:hypothetical protein
MLLFPLHPNVLTAEGEELLHLLRGDLVDIYAVLAVDRRDSAVLL